MLESTKGYLSQSPLLKFYLAVILIKECQKELSTLLSYLMRKVFITNILNVCILVSFTSFSQEVPEKQILQHTVEIPEGQGNGNVLTLQSERQVCILPNEAII